MNFDIGEVLTRAWQISWKNKVLWGITVLPLLISFLLFPIWLVFVFTQNLGSDELFNSMENPNTMIWISAIYILIFIAAMILQIMSRASATLGVYRVEVTHHSTAFADLIKDGFPYFWRILGVGALMVTAMIAFFVAFFACAGILSAATMGLGMLCIQPLFILMIPLMLLGMAFMEQAECAIVADGMGVMDAVSQAYELIKANIWKYILITLVVYIGMSILSSIITVPLIIPMFVFMMNNLENHLDFSNMIKLQAVFGVVILPLMTLIQGFALTYMKSAMMVTYLRFTRSNNAAQPALQVATV